MFVELMPLLAGRTVMITVVREDEKMLRVNVIPKKVKEVCRSGTLAEGTTGTTLQSNSIMT